MVGNDRRNEVSEVDFGEEVNEEQSIVRVLLVNDNVTPMEFVVQVLVDVFQKAPEDATRIMLTTHHRGKGMCGVFRRRGAEVLVERVAALALQNGFPLQGRIEPDILGADILKQQGSRQELPAIVLEAGGGGSRECWALVQECLARRTLVVSYDRAGLGGNSEWAEDVGAAGVVSRLATWLAEVAVDLPPPAFPNTATLFIGADLVHTSAAAEQRDTVTL